MSRRLEEIDSSSAALLMDELSFWSSRFGALLFRHLELRRYQRVLDLGCGTGFPLLELAHVLGTSCRITGVDLWGEALGRAARKREVLGLDRVSISQADAAELPFVSECFDLVVSNLGINNFEDVEAALSECFRVSRPGGRLVLTTNVEGHMQEFYGVFREVLQELGGDGDLRRLEAESEHRSDRAALCALVEASGFEVARAEEDRFELRYRDGSALMDHPLTRLGFLDGWKSVVDPSIRAEVFRRVEQRLNRAADQQGELRMTVPMLYLQAYRP